MAQDACKTCPLKQEYRFKTVCRIRTCKNFSPFTPNRCLGMDIRFSADDKPISDAELLMYKFGDKEMSVRDVSRIRKRSVERLKGTIMLQRLVGIFSEQHNKEEGLDYEEGRSLLVDEVLGNKPLSIPAVGFQPWMLKLLIDKELTSKLIGPKFKLQDALWMKAKDFSEFEGAVKVLGSGDTLFHTLI